MVPTHFHDPFRPSPPRAEARPHALGPALAGRPAGRHRTVPWWLDEAVAPLAADAHDASAAAAAAAAIDAAACVAAPDAHPVASLHRHRPRRRAGVPTGYALLDARLPGGGWPRRALTELLAAAPGAAELRLLAPVLAATLAEGRTVMLFDPPAALSAWALAQVGLDARQLLVIHGRSPSLPDAGSLWALEQALRSGHVGAVVAWLPPRLRAGRLRPLQQAARQHDGVAFMIRAASAGEQPPGAAPLRLAVQPAGADRLALRLLGRRGPAPGGVLQVELPPPFARPARPACGPASPPQAGAPAGAARRDAGDDVPHAAWHAPLHAAVFVDLGA